MSSLTDYAENKLVDHFFRGQSLTLPGSWYFALYTVAPNEAGTGGTEVSGSGYARVAVTRSLAAFAGTQSAGSTSASSGTGGTTSNNADIQFGTPAANWGTVVAAGILDASSAGNLWAVANLAQAKTINSGDPAPKIEAGAGQFVWA